MKNGPTQTGGSSADAPIGDDRVDGAPTNHEPGEIIDTIADAFERQRQTDLEEAYANDPGLASKAAAIDAQIAAANKAAGVPVEDGGSQPIVEEVEGTDVGTQQREEIDRGTRLKDGAAGRDEIYKVNVPGQQQPREDLPTDLQDDPLADYIDMVDGTPMMRMTVDGQVQHIALDAVQAEQQKNVAGSQRLQQAAEAQRQLEEERRQFAEERAAFFEEQARATQATPSQNQPSPDADDYDEVKVATDLTALLFEGKREEAAAGLAQALADVRRSATAVPRIDPDELVRKATQQAREEIKAESHQQQLSQGLAAFNETYSDVAADEDAMLFANAVSKRVQDANPDFTPAQVMMESGKLARAKILGKSTLDDTADPKRQTADPVRRQRKAELVPMPVQRTAVQEPVPEEQPQSAAEVFAEIKAARHQQV